MASSRRPAARARPIRDRSSGARYSGKIVTTSTFTAPIYRSSRPAGGGPASIVNGPAETGSVTSTAPATNRDPGSSVVTSTTTSPRMPCGRVIRPMTSCNGSVRVDDVDPYPAAADRRDDLAQRLGGAPAAPDDRTEVLGVDAHLQPLATTGVDHPDPDLVRMGDHAPDEVLPRRPERAVRLAYRRRHRPSPRSARAAPRPARPGPGPPPLPAPRPSSPPSWPAWSRVPRGRPRPATPPPSAPAGRP